MTAQQIARVQQSWRLIRDLEPRSVGDLFYSRLFVEHPELRVLFPKDMGEQQEKMVVKFNYLIARLDRVHEMQDEVGNLAHRHIGYGTIAQHYQYVGEALLWTLQRTLGDDWTPALAADWRTCLDSVSDMMIRLSQKPQTL